MSTSCLLRTEGVCLVQTPDHSGRFGPFAIADIVAVYIAHASVHGLFRLTVEKRLDKMVSPREDRG